MRTDTTKINMEGGGRVEERRRGRGRKNWEGDGSEMSEMGGCKKANGEQEPLYEEVRTPLFTYVAALKHPVI